MTTVACVFVKGHVPFTSEYVRRLASMVRRWMDRPYRFVCLTDKTSLQPFGPTVEAIRIPWNGDLRGWWAKLHLFAPKTGLTGRVLYLDLDTLVVNSLAPILDYPAPFALVPHSGRFEGGGGLRVVKRFNSSVMVFNAGEQAHLFERFTPDVPKDLWGDQCWIGEQSPNAATMPIEWFPRFSEILNGPVPAAAKVVLMKTPKNVVAAGRYPWVAHAWR
jgi:hypothetical protein